MKILLFSLLFILCALLQYYPHRTMIRPHHIWMNGCFFDTMCDILGGKKVINSPTRVIGSSIAKIGPPCIRSLESWIILSEDIDETCFQELIKPMAFFMSKSMRSFILFWIFEINWLVSNIEISAENNGFMCLEFFDKCAHCSIPLLTI